MELLTARGSAMSFSHLSLFKRSNGLWYIIYQEGGHRRWKSTGEALKAEALQKLTDFRELLRQKPKVITLIQFTAEFLSYASTTYAKPTVDIFAIGLRHLFAIAGDCPLTQINSKHVDRYKAERLKSVTATSVNVEVRGLRAVFNVAMRWKMVENNPFSGVQLLRIPEQPPIYFTKEDFKSLITIITENWLKEVVVFAALTGLRRGEIINLRWQEIDLQRKLINIQSTASFKTKQGKRRTLPLSEASYRLLEMKMKQSSNDYVFSLNNERI
jgi:integrase